MIFALSSTVLHMTFGLPHPWLPCEFQSKASWVVYEVYGPAIPISDEI
jgi:hypothetical protein